MKRVIEISSATITIAATTPSFFALLRTRPRESEDPWHVNDTENDIFAMNRAEIV
jgi:hypothetical protein